MTNEQRKKIGNRVMFLSIGTLVLLIIALILIGVAGKAETLIFPIVIAIFLAIYWVISDVLSVIWLKDFEGKTDDQKKFYYAYAGVDLIGLGGLVYFMVDMKSMTGALIYVACLFLKRKFREEFNGIKKEEEEEAEETAEFEEGIEALESAEFEEGAEAVEAAEFEEGAETVGSAETEEE